MGSKRGPLAVGLRRLLPVTARRILKGDSKQGRAGAMAALSGSRLGDWPPGDPLNWQGWTNAAVVVAAGEKKQYPVRTPPHECIVSLKCRTVL